MGGTNITRSLLILSQSSPLQTTLELFLVLKKKKKSVNKGGPGEMAQQIREVAILVKDLGSIPSNPSSR